MQSKGLGYSGIRFAVLLLNCTLNLLWHKEARMTLVFYWRNT